MATKAELLQKISEKYEKVDDPVKVEETFGVATYDVNVFETNNGMGIKRTVSFYVKDEGLAGESAFVRQEVEESTFKKQVLAYIATKEDDKTIIKGMIAELNEEKQYAIVRVLMLVNNKIEDKKYLLYNDGGPKFYEMNLSTQ